MRIAIWQQFSSNHSSDFTVVGTFQTSEAAAQAAQQLRLIMETIVNWYEQPENHDIKWQVLRSFEHPPTQPEIRCAEQYGVSWAAAVDWLANIGLDRINAAVTVYDRHVFVSNRAETNTGEGPFDQLMARFTDHVVVDVSAAQRALLTLTCHVLDRETRQTLYTDLQAYLASPDLADIPWLGYYPANGLAQDRGEASQTFVIRAIDLYGEGQVQLENQTLSLRMWFTHVGRALPALINYLTSYGCADIDYTLIQE